MNKKKRLKNGIIGTLGIRECTRSMFQMLYSSKPIEYITFKERNEGKEKLHKIEGNILIGKSNTEEIALFINGKFITGIFCIKYLFRDNDILIVAQGFNNSGCIIIDRYANEIARGNGSSISIVKEAIITEFNERRNLRYTPWECRTEHFKFKCKTVQNGKYRILKIDIFDIMSDNILHSITLDFIVDAMTNKVLNNKIYDRFMDYSEWSICQIWKGLYRCTEVNEQDLSEITKVIDLNREGKVVIDNNQRIIETIDGYYTIIEDIEQDRKARVTKFNRKTREFDAVTPDGIKVMVGWNRERKCNGKVLNVPTARVIGKIDRDEVESLIPSVKAEVKLRVGNQLGKRHTYGKNKKQILSQKDKVWYE